MLIPLYGTFFIWPECYCIGTAAVRVEILCMDLRPLQLFPGRLLTSLAQTVKLDMFALDIETSCNIFGQ